MTKVAYYGRHTEEEDLKIGILVVLIVVGLIGTAAECWLFQVHVGEHWVSSHSENIDVELSEFLCH